MFRYDRMLWNERRPRAMIPSSWLTAGASKFCGNENIRINIETHITLTDIWQPYYLTLNITHTFVQPSCRINFTNATLTLVYYRWTKANRLQHYWHPRRPDTCASCFITNYGSASTTRAVRRTMLNYSIGHNANRQYHWHSRRQHIYTILWHAP